MPEPVTVRVSDCRCPGAPHPDGDLVYLAPTLSLAAGLEAEAMLLAASEAHPLPAGTTDKAEGGDVHAMQQLEEAAARRLLWLRPSWFPLFVRQALGWNRVDENGPVPFDVDAILADYALARAVADAAADLYQPAILAPFLTPPEKHSDSGRTAGGTHPPTEPIRLRSRRSSGRASAGVQ